MPIWQLLFGIPDGYGCSANGPVQASVYYKSFCADEQLCGNIQNCSYFPFYHFSGWTNIQSVCYSSTVNSMGALKLPIHILLKTKKACIYFISLKQCRF